MTTRPYFVHPPMVVALVIAALIAQFGSEQWTASPYWPGSFIHWMETLFPPIAVHARKSAFPATTELYMSVCFLLMPLHAWCAYRVLITPTSQAWYRNLWTMRSVWALIGRLAVVLVILAITGLTLFAPIGYDFNLLPYHTSRVALAAVGWVVAGAAQGWMLAWIFCNLVLTVRFIRSRRKKQTRLR